MNFSEAPKAALGITSGAAIFVVLGCLSLFALMSRQGGDIAYAKALRLDANNGDLNEIVRQLNRATSRDGANPIYHRTLAAAYLAQASSGSATDSADGDFSPEDTQRLANFANLAIQSANKAVQVGESDAANWASAGVIYRELMPVVQNSQNFAVNTLAQAVLLEPGNPAYMTDLGRVYLAVADRAQAVQDLADVSEDVKAQASANEVEHLRVAEEKFTKALELKSDYALANYYLAATFERQGKLDEATDRLSALTKVQPNDTGLGFQLGVIQIKRNDLDAASAEFERVLNIYPNYSNAMWYLAAIKANKGDAAGAITLLNKVLELNPDSQVVKDSIRNLEVGGSTPVEPAPIADGQVDTNTTP
jgi:tetratricopeptide (TPR) repeat protein